MLSWAFPKQNLPQFLHWLNFREIGCFYSGIKPYERNLSITNGRSGNDDYFSIPNEDTGTKKFFEYILKVNKAKNSKMDENEKDCFALQSSQ
uniref:Uncharacterized protein n=1 Tax=Romanomermis culicivorax TaxID=13658 RepID=A0A915KNN1_ROMCU